MNCSIAIRLCVEAQRLVVETDEEALEIQRILKFNHKKGPITNPEINETNSYREYAYQRGLVFCAECGSKCITKSAKRKHGGMYYYFAWHTLCPDDKVKIFQQIVHKITVQNGKVKEVILKI